MPFQACVGTPFQIWRPSKPKPEPVTQNSNSRFLLREPTDALWRDSWGALSPAEAVRVIEPITAGLSPWTYNLGVSVYIYIYTSAHMYMYVCMQHTCIDTHTHMFGYVCIYIYKYTHAHIRITYTYVRSIRYQPAIRLTRQTDAVYSYIEPLKCFLIHCLVVSVMWSMSSGDLLVTPREPNTPQLRNLA